MTSPLDELIDNPNSIAKIHDALVIDDDFKAFCAALGIGQAMIFSLLKKDDREYLALREWTNAIHTIDDFVHNLVKCNLEALAFNLNLGNQYRSLKTSSSETKDRVFSITKPSLFIERPEFEVLLSYVKTNANNNPVIVLRSSDGVPGGTGKTTLARALAAKLRSEGLFAGQHLMLELKGAQQNTPEERTKAIRLAKECAIENCGGMRVDATMKEAEIDRAYKKALASIGLLLIDDAGLEEDVRSLMLWDDPISNTLTSTSATSTSSSSSLPQRSFCTIVTTRESLVFAGAHPVEVGMLNDDDSIKVLRSFEQNISISDDDLKKIATKCGHVALALSIVGATMAKSKTFTVQKMIKYFVSNSVAKGMNGTLKWSYDVLDPHLQEILLKTAIFPFPFTNEAFVDAFHVDEGVILDLDNLVQRAWLSWLKEEERFAIHDVVREYVYSLVDANQRAKMSNFVRKYFVSLIRISEEKYLTKEYAVAIKTVMNEMNSILWLLETDSSGLLLDVSINPFGVFNLFVSAQRRLTYFNKIVDGIEKGNVNSRMLTAKHNYAWALYERGQYPESSSLMRDAFDQRCKLLGIDHDDSMLSQQCLVVILQDGGYYDEAYKVLNARSILLEQLLGPEHLYTLMTKHDLAGVLSNQEKHDEAVALYRNVLAIQERVFRVEHSQTLTTIYNFGWELSNQNQHDEAVSLYRTLLSVRERILGVEHPDTLTAKHSLAWALCNQEKYDEALSLYNNVLSVRERVLGSKHSDTLATKHDMASALSSQGKHEQAAALYRYVSSIEEEMLGVEHPDTLLTKHNLATALNSQGKHGEAIAMLRAVLSIRERVLRVEHPDTLQTKRDLDETLEMQHSEEFKRRRVD